MRFLLLIPARTGSKTIKDKNFAPLLGTPLWKFTYAQAQIVAEYIKSLGDEAEVVISSDDPSRFDVPVLNRPAAYATDDSPVIDTIRHALDNHPADAVVLLQTTSPLRLPEDIAKCVALFVQRGGVHPVVTGYIMRIKEKGKTDSKSKPVHFQRNGAVFVIPNYLIQAGDILDGHEYEVEMPKSRSVDIDDYDDWYMTEALFLRRLNETAE